MVLHPEMLRQCRLVELIGADAVEFMEAKHGSIQDFINAEMSDGLDVWIQDESRAKSVDPEPHHKKAQVQEDADAEPIGLCDNDQIRSLLKSLMRMRRDLNVMRDSMEVKVRTSWNSTNTSLDGDCLRSLVDVQVCAV